jgi:WD40 repeat protein
MLLRRVPLAAVVCFLFSSRLPAQDTPKKDDKLPDQVSYYKDVRPIFMIHCQGCHQPAKAQGGFVMTSHADLFKKGDHLEFGIIAGHPEKSMIMKQILPDGGKPPAMPRGKDPLTEREINLIKKWIAQGALNDTPASVKAIKVDMDNPPVYHMPPVISALAYSPDGSVLAVSGYHEILIHKAEGGLIARLVGASERIQSLAFSPDGKLLAATGGSPGRFGEVQIWEHAKKKLKLSLPITFDTVYGASWSHDGTRLAFGCSDNSVRAIDISEGKQILFQGGHSDWVLDTVWSKDSSYLVSVSRDMSMKLTEVSTGRLVDNITSITPGALKGGLQAVDRHPTKDELLIGGADGVPKIYQMIRTKDRKIGDDYNLIRAFPALPGRIFDVRYNKDGSRIIVGASSNGRGEVRIFEATGKLVSTLEGERGPVYAVGYRPDGKQVASAGFDGMVRLNDPETGKLIREFVPCPLKTPPVTAE